MMNDPPVRPLRPTRSNRYQFGIWSLLMLTTLVAAILSLIRALDLPQILRGVLAGYAILMGGYVAMRLPYLWKQHRQTISDLQRYREQLREWTERQRR